MQATTGINRELVSAIVFATVFLAFGPFAGIAVAQRVAGGSTLATVATAGMLPAAFLAGNGAWIVVFVVRAAAKGASAVLRRRRGESPVARRETAADPVPGAWVWVPVLTLVSLLAGALSGAPAGGWEIVDATAAYGAFGLALGIVLWRLGRAGVIEPLVFG